MKDKPHNKSHRVHNPDVPFDYEMQKSDCNIGVHQNNLPLPPNDDDPVINPSEDDEIRDILDKMDKAMKRYESSDFGTTDSLGKGVKTSTRFERWKDSFLNVCAGLWEAVVDYWKDVFHAIRVLSYFTLIGVGIAFVLCSVISLGLMIGMVMQMLLIHPIT